MEKQKTELSMPKETHKWLKRWCFENEVSMNATINKLIDDFKKEIENKN